MPFHRKYTNEGGNGRSNLKTDFQLHKIKNVKATAVTKQVVLKAEKKRTKTF